MRVFARNLFLVIDKAANVLLLGSPHHTLSMRLGFAVWCEYVIPKPIAVTLMKAVDWLFWNQFWKIEKDHCYHAYEAEEARSRSIWELYQVADREGFDTLLKDIESLTHRGRIGRYSD